MLAEQKELYNFTKDHFDTELSRITKHAASPIIAVRQVVKQAIDKYIQDYCSKNTKIEEVFTDEDFKTVSNKICNEIMEGLTMGDIFQALIEAGITQDQISNHESDLYVIKNDISTKIISEYEYKGNVTTFISQIDKKVWYDIPFAYTPYWNKKT